MLRGDSRLSSVLVATLIYVLCTLAIFNVSYGLLLALVDHGAARPRPAPSSAPSGCCRG